MQSTINNLPHHLKKYVVDQNYEKYTYEDQAVWRYILRQLKNYLASTAHDAYLDGLVKTGITIDEIPRIENIDKKLKEFGWSAIPISGFIPPAAFMEFQSLGVLPIASDIRTRSHILYTPAPDIVHESAGHAPILIEPNFAKYLKRYAEVASKAIFSKEDLDMYAAIRDLSDAKEDPHSTPDQIKQFEANLEKVSDSMTYVSEAALLARMNWWTAEYGLIGDLKDPKIFGAGLLSSLGESKSCLEDSVKKIPLDLHCVDYSYDITEKQPQLFVADTFQSLIDVLDELSGKMAYKIGGKYGLDCAIESRTVNTIQLNSDLQVSGKVVDHIDDGDGNIVYYKLEGPTQLAFDSKQIPHQGTDHHPHGFSSPLGLLKDESKCLSDFTDQELIDKGLEIGQSVRLEYSSGVLVEGRLKSITKNNKQVQILTFEDCKVTFKDTILFDPSWGVFDMAVGSKIDSVYGGPADRDHYLEEIDDFKAQIIPLKKYSDSQIQLFQQYKRVRELRSQWDESKMKQAVDDFLSSYADQWLIGLELFELATQKSHQSLALLKKHLEALEKEQPENASLIRQGIDLSESP